MSRIPTSDSFLSVPLGMQVTGIDGIEYYVECEDADKISWDTFLAKIMDRFDIKDGDGDIEIYDNNDVLLDKDGFEIAQKSQKDCDFWDGLRIVINFYTPGKKLHNLLQEASSWMEEGWCEKVVCLLISILNEKIANLETAQKEQKDKKESVFIDAAKQLSDVIQLRDCLQLPYARPELQPIKHRYDEFIWLVVIRGTDVYNITPYPDGDVCIVKR